MEKEFAAFMLDEKFSKAAELIFDAAMNVKVPADVNLTINIDRESNIIDLSSKMEVLYGQINNSYSEINFDSLWNGIFNRDEFSAKQGLKQNAIVLDKAKLAYADSIRSFKTKQFGELFAVVTSALNSTLQATVNAAVKL